MQWNSERLRFREPYAPQLVIGIPIWYTCDLSFRRTCMKNKNNKVYKIDIFLNLFCLYQLKNFVEKEDDLSDMNNQIITFVRKYSFTDFFPEEEFIFSRDRIERMFNSVSKALFLRNQSNYYTRYTDILTTLLASNFILHNNSIINYITDDLNKEDKIHFLPKFRKLAEIGRPIINREIKKIRFYLNRKNNTKTSNQKVLATTVK